MAANPKPKDYSTGEVTVRWDASKCYHAAECVKGLPRVFNPKRRPWIELDHANADEIKEVVGRCPSGALSIVEADGDAAERATEAVAVTVIPTGPYRIQGNFVVTDMEGNELPTGNTAALCACGQSSKKPFCDGSHKSLSGYQAPHK